MTTTFHLVRHGSHDRLDHMLCGRMPGVSLGEEGREQARRIGERLAREPLAAVYASPMDRTVETAAPIAAAHGLSISPEEGLTEIDVGTWAGKPWSALEGDPGWTLWNTQRALARPPGGETMVEVQARAVAALAAIRAAHPDAAVAVVSHSDVLKLLVAYHLGLGVEAWARMEVDPASLSTLLVGDWGSKLQSLNDVSHLSPQEPPP